MIDMMNSTERKVSSGRPRGLSERSRISYVQLSWYTVRKVTCKVQEKLKIWQESHSSVRRIAKRDLQLEVFQRKKEHLQRTPATRTSPAVWFWSWETAAERHCREEFTGKVWFSGEILHGGLNEQLLNVTDSSVHTLSVYIVNNATVLLLCVFTCKCKMSTDLSGFGFIVCTIDALYCQCS